MLQEIVDKLKEIPMEAIEKAIEEQEDRDIFEILLICKELKKLLSKTPRTYKEILEWDFYWMMYYHALRTWLNEYGEKLKEVKL